MTQTTLNFDVKPRDPNVDPRDVKRLTGQVITLQRDARNPLAYAEFPTCSFPECGEEAYAGGLCSAHYQQKKKGKPLMPRINRKTRKCTFPGCNRRYNAHGLCRTHIAQKMRGEELRPIGILKPFEYALDGNSAYVFMRDREGNVAAVSAIDADCIPLVSEYRWILNPTNYAVAHGPNNTTIWMHRLIAGNPDGLQVDHWDGDRLNNRRNNLIPVTPAMNAQNAAWPGRELERNVYYEKRGNAKRRWKVVVQKDRKAHYGGMYETKEEAIEVARKMRLQLFEHCNHERHEADGGLNRYRLVREDGE